MRDTSRKRDPHVSCQNRCADPFFSAAQSQSGKSPRFLRESFGSCDTPLTLTNMPVLTGSMHWRTQVAQGGLPVPESHARGGHRRPRHSAGALTRSRGRGGGRQRGDLGSIGVVCIMPSHYEHRVSTQGENPPSLFLPFDVDASGEETRQRRHRCTGGIMGVMGVMRGNGAAPMRSV